MCSNEPGRFMLRFRDPVRRFMGCFASRAVAQKAAARLQRDGVPAVVTTTLTRRQYWKKISSFAVSSFQIG